MCGRYTLKSSERALQAAFPGVVFPDELPPRFNIAPTQPVLAITGDDPSHATFLRWGLVPPWGKDLRVGSKLINARAEDAARKPAFRAAYQRRRCALIADGFYEWRPAARGKKKEPVFYALRDGAPFAFAGLWERWWPKHGAEPIATCTLLTTDANELVRLVHDRMPVLLRPQDIARWLDPQTDSDELLAPFPAEEMRARDVSNAVNDATHEAADCLAPAQ